MKQIALLIVLLLCSCTTNARLINNGIELNTLTGRGSGVIVELNNKPYVLTVAHIVAVLTEENKGNILWVDESAISEDNNFGLVGVEARLVAKNVKKDIALLEVLGPLSSNVVISELASPTLKLQRGDEIVTVSGPGMSPSMILRGTIAAKFVNNGLPYLLVTSQSAAGSSGGGIFYKGKLIGLVLGTAHEPYRIPNSPLLVNVRINFLTIAVPFETIRIFLEKTERNLL